MSVHTFHGVRCGNRAQHGTDVVYHTSTQAVRDCFAESGRFQQVERCDTEMREAYGLPIRYCVTHGQDYSACVSAGKSAQQVEARVESVWHSTGPSVEEGHYESRCPGASCPVIQQEAQVSARQEAEKREAANRRYAAWRSIPVFGKGRGYYAVADDMGHVSFFRVERPSKGKHAGRTFLSIQAGDRFERLASWHTMAAFLDAIAADPATASLRYAREIGKCSSCNRTLTDDDSRARGMGPDCAAKWGAR